MPPSRSPSTQPPPWNQTSTGYGPSSPGVSTRTGIAPAGPGDRAVDLAVDGRAERQVAGLGGHLRSGRAPRGRIALGERRQVGAGLLESLEERLGLRVERHTGLLLSWRPGLS